MVLYKTVKQEGCAEQTIEKSKFICYVRPVENREEAEDFFTEIKKKHRDATHNVPAMVIGEHMQVQWGSDDGEPQGTSGAPIVQMLVGEGITNVAIVVTRYFGGIKLGTGGLVRAYTSSAKLGLLEAQICAVEELTALSFIIDYSSLSKVQNNESDVTYSIKDISYTENVEIVLLVEQGREDEITNMISNFTNGKAVLKERKSMRIAR